MKPNKLSSRLLALALSLVLSLSLSLPALAAGEDDIIYIHTAKDLCALSDSCAYDAWSRGKTVLLTADISLRGVDFEPIASFSGTFNGGGHTIRGIVPDADTYCFLSKYSRNAALENVTIEYPSAVSGMFALLVDDVDEGSFSMENCTVTGNMSDTKGTSSDENVHNVMIYQSMSGDADVGTSTFSMTGGTLTAKNGDMIYVTNTHCVLTLSGVAIRNEDADGVLLRVAGNSASHGWGTAGSNGAQVEFTADGQVLTGDIVVDTISTLNMKLTNGSSFTGAINIVDNAQNGAAVSNNAVVTIESGCTWTLTGNCTLTSLTNNGTIQFNGYTITLADGTVLG